LRAGLPLEHRPVDQLGQPSQRVADVDDVDRLVAEQGLDPQRQRGIAQRTAAGRRGVGRVGADRAQCIAGRAQHRFEPAREGVADRIARRAQRDQWADELGSAIQARIDAVGGPPYSPAWQDCIRMLERTLLEVSTLQLQDPAQPPAMPSERPAPPPRTMIA
jgi:hypothetical protein